MSGRSVKLRALGFVKAVFFISFAVDARDFQWHPVIVLKQLFPLVAAALAPALVLGRGQVDRGIAREKSIRLERKPGVFHGHHRKPGTHCHSFPMQPRVAL